MFDGRLGVSLADITPPPVHGLAVLASMLYAGAAVGEVLDLIGPEPGGPARAGWLMDRSWLAWLNRSPFQAASLQRQALALSSVFRVRGGTGPRVLALAAPGDPMVNAPLDFITAHAGLSLDIAYAQGALPDHDVAIVVASESAPDTLRALAPLFGAWPRPILNDPARILPMSRTGLPRTLAGLPGLLTAAARQMPVADLIAAAYPVLLRPAGSHGGHGLVRLDGPGDWVGLTLDAPSYVLTDFIDYRSPDGLYRKRRIAFVDQRPFLCHMAVSDHWMVHFLNADMDNQPARRADEEAAMAGFDAFTARHALAFAGLTQAIGLDYFSIDCAEAPDGRLLVFEADVAGIIHSMDSPALYPYKQAAMQRCYDAFGAMIRRTCLV